MPPSIANAEIHAIASFWIRAFFIGEPPVSAYIDKGEGLFPMCGFGRTGRRQLTSASCRVLFAEPPLAGQLGGAASQSDRPAPVHSPQVGPQSSRLAQAKPLLPRGTARQRRLFPVE